MKQLINTQVCFGLQLSWSARFMYIIYLIWISFTQHLLSQCLHYVFIQHFIFPCFHVNATLLTDLNPAVNFQVAPHWDNKPPGGTRFVGLVLQQPGLWPLEWQQSSHWPLPSHWEASRCKCLERSWRSPQTCRCRFSPIMTNSFTHWTTCWPWRTF